MVDTEAVRDALREVYDPEIPVNIVDLGLIYEIEERDDAENAIHIEMTLTSMGCPIADQLKRNVSVAARSVDDIEDVSVELVWEPPWSPQDATEDGKAQLQSLGISIPNYDDEGEEATANEAPF
ncbi:MAG: metal-sulfur cluster assembly factor [Halanaeroarchaeum sp.]